MTARRYVLAQSLPPGQEAVEPEWTGDGWGPHGTGKLYPSTTRKVRGMTFTRPGKAAFGAIKPALAALPPEARSVGVYHKLKGYDQ